MRKRSEQFKAISFTVIVVIFWLFAPVAYKSMSRDIFREFQAPVWNSLSQISDLQTYWAGAIQSNKNLFEAGKDLARLNAAYRVVMQRNEALLNEIAGLQEILKLPPLPKHRVIVARVSRREMNAWWQELTIRVGKDNGIPVNAAVIFGDGVVGRIKEVGETSSTVELVSSRSFRMAAIFEGDTRPVTYQGQLNHSLGPAYGHVRDVPSDLRASEGIPLRLVSSRLGGFFPEGLVIGLVSSLEPDTNGLFTEGIVQLNERLLDVNEVAVLVPISSSVSNTTQPGDNIHAF